MLSSRVAASQRETIGMPKVGRWKREKQKALLDRKGGLAAPFPFR